MVHRFSAVYRRLLERRLLAEQLIREQDALLILADRGLATLNHRQGIRETIAKYDRATQAVQEIE